MNRFKLFLGFLGIALISFTILFNSCAKKEDNSIKVGVILPLTGNLAFLGKPIQQAFDIFLEDNREYFEKNNISFNILYGDSKGNAGEAVTLANKLIKIDKVNILMPFLTNVSQAVSPISQNSNVFTMALCTYPPIVDNPVTVKLFYDFEKESRIISDFINKRGKKNILILKSNDAASTYQVDKYFEKYITQYKIKFNVIEFKLGNKDFKNIIPTNLNKYDCITVFGFGTDFPEIFKMIHNYGFNFKEKLLITGIGTYEIPRTTPYDLIKNVYFTAPTYIVDNKPQFEEFNQKYAQKYKIKEIPFMSVLAYDNLIAIRELIIKNKSIVYKDGKNIKEELIKIGVFNGISGEISISNYGNGSSGISVVKFNNSFESISKAN